jgi:hypothetical protein
VVLQNGAEYRVRVLPVALSFQGQIRQVLEEGCPLSRKTTMNPLLQDPLAINEYFDIDDWEFTHVGPENTPVFTLTPEGKKRLPKMLLHCMTEPLACTW